MFRAKKFLFVALIGLWAGSVGAVEDEGGIRAACVKELEDAWKDVIVNDQIKALQAVIKKYHLNTPYFMVIEPGDSPMEIEIGNKGYPSECDTYMESFWKGVDNAPCSVTMPDDDSFREIFSQNKKVHDVWVAAQVCLYSKEIHDKKNAADDTTDAEPLSED